MLTARSEAVWTTVAHMEVSPDPVEMKVPAGNVLNLATFATLMQSTTYLQSATYCRASRSAWTF